MLTQEDKEINKQFKEAIAVSKASSNLNDAIKNSIILNHNT